MAVGARCEVAVIVTPSRLFMGAPGGILTVTVMLAVAHGLSATDDAASLVGHTLPLN